MFGKHDNLRDGILVLSQNDSNAKKENKEKGKNTQKIQKDSLGCHGQTIVFLYCVFHEIHPSMCVTVGTRGWEVSS